jgi:imidazoleglycerol phosphate dehydratase HisB|tara:strand:- start:2150 stop:2479 length:330 start_codon:yes stop_codon:yes gene_type:complete
MHEDIRNLHKKVDANHKEAHDNVIKPLNDVAVQLGRLATSMDHNRLMFGRLETSQIEMGKRLNSTILDHSNRLTTIESNQSNTKNIWDKIGFPLLMVSVFVLAGLNYFK